MSSGALSGVANSGSDSDSEDLPLTLESDTHVGSDTEAEAKLNGDEAAKLEKQAQKLFTGIEPQIEKYKQTDQVLKGLVQYGERVQKAIDAEENENTRDKLVGLRASIDSLVAARSEFIAEEVRRDTYDKVLELYGKYPSTFEDQILEVERQREERIRDIVDQARQTIEQVSTGYEKLLEVDAGRLAAAVMPNLPGGMEFNIGIITVPPGGGAPRAAPGGPGGDGGSGGSVPIGRGGSGSADESGAWSFSVVADDEIMVERPGFEPSQKMFSLNPEANSKLYWTPVLTREIASYLVQSQYLQKRYPSHLAHLAWTAFSKPYIPDHVDLVLSIQQLLRVWIADCVRDDKCIAKPSRRMMNDRELAKILRAYNALKTKRDSLVALSP